MVTSSALSHGRGRYAGIGIGISCLTVQFAVFAARPTISYRALDLGADGVTVGLIAAAFAVLPLLIATAAGSWADRVGGRNLVLLGSAVLGGVLATLLFATQIWVLIAASALLGFGHILTAVGSQSYVAVSHGRQLDAAFATLTLSVSLGQLLGPLLLTVADMQDTTARGGLTEGQASRIFGYCAVAALISLLAAVALPHRRSAGRPTPGHVLRDAGTVLRVPRMTTILLASLAVLGAIDVLVVYLPVFGEEVGLSPTVVGILLAVRAGASLVSRIFVPWLISTWSRTRVLSVSLALPGIAVLLLPFLATTWLVWLLVILAGAGLGLGQPLTMAWVAASSPSEIRGTALGVRLAANRLGQVVTPAVAGGMASLAGTPSIFLLLFAVLAGAGLLVSRGDFNVTSSPELADQG